MTEEEEEVITPGFAEMLLTRAFPGAGLAKGVAVGRKATFSMQFGEFSIAIYCPQDPRMTVATTFTFRRRVSGKTLHRVNAKLERTDVEGLSKQVRQARGYVLGIFVALESVLEPPSPIIADILGG